MGVVGRYSEGRQCGGPEQVEAAATAPGAVQRSAVLGIGLRLLTVCLRLLMEAEAASRSRRQRRMSGAPALLTEVIVFRGRDVALEVSLCFRPLGG